MRSLRHYHIFVMGVLLFYVTACALREPDMLQNEAVRYTRNSKTGVASNLTPILPDKARCQENASPFGEQTCYDSSPQPGTRVTPIKPKTLSEAQGYLLGHKADLHQFRLRGPFAVHTRENQELALSPTERIDMDLYLSAPAEKAPLVIFLHGHDSSKEAHAYQAMHVASWGMHSLVLQLPNKGPWVRNGRTLVRIVDFIYRQSEVIDSHIDVNRIILVGHSFGGSAVAIALAEGARSVGGILLDPAGIGKELPKFLGKINKPVMLLGADDEVSSALNRDYFYQFIHSGIVEVSIKDAAHEDAQYPFEPAVHMFGINPFNTEELQVTFVSALTSAAFSLAFTGKLDYAWNSFGDFIENGKFINAKKK